MKIGERIKTLREWQGLTQADLALKAKCTASAVNQYESDKRTPSLKHFRNICKALGISYTLLLDGVELSEEPETE